jgi:hypothetical protein
MSAPPGDVVDRLERLAAHAPGGGLDPDAVWTHGRRRQRVRLGAALAALVAVGLLGTTATPLLVERAQRVEPAGSDDTMVLPDVIRQPGGWEPEFPSVPGRLSAVGVGTRSSLWSDRNAWWGVSAETGESRFLDVPDAADTFVDAALSADGSRMAYWTKNDADDELAGSAGSAGDSLSLAGGVAVLDLQTGKHQTWEVESPHGLWTGGLAWAGDVLWWSAGPAQQEASGAVRADTRLRTWDVATGERGESSTGIGPHAVGDAPNGFVEIGPMWRLERVTGGADPEMVKLLAPAGTRDGAGLAEPAVSTDGSRVAVLLMPDASRFDGAPKPLLVGAVDGREVALQQVDGVEEQSVLGWRSPTEVVVASQDAVEEGRPPRALRAWTVDITTSEREQLVSFSGNTPQVAAEAWTAEVVPAPGAPFAPDPRLVGLGLLAAAFVVWRIAVRVRSRRGNA